MRSTVLFITILLSVFGFSQDQIKIDKYGVISDSLQLKSLQEKYALIGLFQKVSDKSNVRFARVLRKQNDGQYLWGYINLSGEEVIPTKYNSLSVFDQGLVIAKENIAQKVKFRCGRPIPCIRTEMNPYFYFIDENGTQVSHYYEEIEESNYNSYMPSVVNAKIDGRTAVYDKTRRKEVFRTAREQTVRMLDSLNRYFLVVQDQKTGMESLVDRNGKYWGDFKYHNLMSVGNSIFAMKDRLTGNAYSEVDKYYLLDKQFNIISDSVFTERTDEIYEGGKHKEKLLIFKKKGRYLLVNEKGKTVAGDFQHLTRIGGLYFAITIDKNVGILNKNGRYILKPTTDYKYFYQQTNKDFVMMNRGDYIFDLFDLKKQKIIKANERLGVWSGSKKYLRTGEEGAQGVLDYQNREVLPKKYLAIEPVADTGYFIVTNQHGKTGIVNAKGETTVPFIYDNDPYDLAMWVPYNEKDQKDISKYWFIFTVDDETTFFGERYGVVDYRNRVILPFEYSQINFHPQKTYWKNGKMGVITHNRKFIPAEYQGYDEISYSADLYALRNKDNKSGIVDENNKVIIPFVYDEITRIYQDDFYAGKFLTLGVSVKEDYYNYNKVIMVKKGGEPFLKESSDAFFSMSQGILLDGGVFFDIYERYIAVYSAPGSEKKDFK